LQKVFPSPKPPTLLRYPEIATGASAPTSISLSASLYYISANAFSGTSLSEITFRGTMDEWEDITMETLLTDCSNLTVTCADGNVYHYVNGTCVD